MSAARALRASLLACGALAACRRPPPPVAVEAPAPVPPFPMDTGAVGRRPRPSVDPATAQRFEIVAVGDSTLTFLARRASWVDSGRYGIAVDPRRRDLLVARFEVLARQGDSATAVVTGQTQRVTPDHVALLERPAEPDTVTVVRVVRPRARFWEGVLTGSAVGVLLGLVLR